MNPFADPALPTLALCSAILVLKMLIVGHISGWLRMKSATLASPEDYAAFRIEKEGKTSDAGDALDRHLRVHHNDLESTLPFLAISLLFLATGPSLGLAKGLFIWFTVCRLVFSFCYIRGLQPWRSASFLLGEVALVIMLVKMLMWGISNWA